MEEEDEEKEHGEDDETNLSFFSTTAHSIRDTFGYSVSEQPGKRRKPRPLESVRNRSRRETRDSATEELASAEGRHIPRCLLAR